VSRRFPADWQRRKEEDAQEQGELKASRVPHGLFSFFHRNSLQGQGRSPGPASSGGAANSGPSHSGVAHSGASSHPSQGRN